MAPRPLATVALGALAVLAACGLTSVEPQSLYPPEDFRLELLYQEHVAGETQIKRTASIDKAGLVIVREADASLRSADGSVVLPVYRRLCAYQLAEQSIRILSRRLERYRPAEIRQQDDPRPSSPKVRELVFRLTYAGNDVDLRMRDLVYGQMTQVLHEINAFLPQYAQFALPSMTGAPLDRHVQDVPPFADSVQESLDFHLRRAEGSASADLRRDVFALAIAAGNRELAEQQLRVMATLTPEQRAELARLLDQATPK